MSSILEDINAASLWISKALASSGYAVDFSPASLWQIERFFQEHSENGGAKPGGLLSDQLGVRLFSIGAYVGEVIRQSRGGQWVGDDNDPAVELNVELHLSDGTVCWPMQRIVNRVSNGEEDSIIAYAQGFDVSVGPRPAS